ncbi:hypothetical protein CsSME_00031602 [Camellia sinensis var. sinensis]
MVSFDSSYIWQMPKLVPYLALALTATKCAKSPKPTVSSLSHHPSQQKLPKQKQNPPKNKTTKKINSKAKFQNQAKKDIFISKNVNPISGISANFRNFRDINQSKFQEFEAI